MSNPLLEEIIEELEKAVEGKEALKRYILKYSFSISIC